MDENNISNIITPSMNSKELMNTIAMNIVNSCIDSCIEHVIEREKRGFYLLKYNKSTEKYTSHLIEYTSIIKDFNEKKYFLIDILHLSTNLMNNILPIPILNGKFLKENICINNLNHKLLIVFITMKNIDSSTTFSYFMNAINNSDADLNVFNSTTFNGFQANNFATQIQNIFNSTQMNETPAENIPPTNTIISNISFIPTIPSLQPAEPVQPPSIPLQYLIPLSAPPPNIALESHRESYSDEIEQMKAMGFTDEYKIIESLIVSDGDVNNAIHYYLQ